jgi:hypothetical protein
MTISTPLDLRATGRHSPAQYKAKNTNLIALSIIPANCKNKKRGELQA